MEVNRQKQRPMSVSTVSADVVDGFTTLPQDEYTSSYQSQDTTSTYIANRKALWCLIAFIIATTIIALLTVAALIIAIYSLVLNTNKNTVSISSITTSVSIPCSSSPPTYYQYSTTAPAQCSSYILNTDATRNIGYSSSINYCDNTSPFKNTTSVWIRFREPAGTLLVNAPVSPNYCGTVATGWYAGQYPATTFTTATSNVCFYYSTNTCIACAVISITNCQAFYVYYLPTPPACNYRYCTL